MDQSWLSSPISAQQPTTTVRATGKNAFVCCKMANMLPSQYHFTIFSAKSRGKDLRFGVLLICLIYMLFHLAAHSSVYIMPTCHFSPSWKFFEVDWAERQWLAQDHLTSFLTKDDLENGSLLCQASILIARPHWLSVLCCSCFLSINTSLNTCQPEIFKDAIHNKVDERLGGIKRRMSSKNNSRMKGS